MPPFKKKIENMNHAIKIIALIRRTKANIMRSMHSFSDHLIITLSLATDVTDMTLGASGLWLGIRRGAAGTATLA